MHKDIKCESCHQERKYKPVPVDCASCHSDITRFYKGRFASYSSVIPSEKSAIVGCERCHETDKKDFKVDAAKCLSCHVKPYDDYFNVWNGFIREELSGLKERTQRLASCESQSPGLQTEMMGKMEGLSFLEKNFYHNYRLSAGVIQEWKEYLDRAAMEECRE